MKRVTVTAELEVRLLETVLRRSVASAAQETGLSYTQAGEIARRHGYPDVDAVRASLAELRAAGRAEPTEAAAAMGGRELLSVKVQDLHPDPDNPREDVGDVDELAASIRESGLLQPIVARRHGTALVVVAGHRRLAALQRLGVDVTEVLVVKDMRPADVLAAMLIENGQRRDLDPIEEARAYDRLRVDRGWTADDVAKRVGRSKAVVYERLALLNLSLEQQELVRAGQMSRQEGAQAGRARAGTTRTHATYRFHLGAEHPLAGNARARCLRVHKQQGVTVRIVGSTACGECWEHVIRADETRHAYRRSASTGQCVVCEQPLPGHHGHGPDVPGLEAVNG